MNHRTYFAFLVLILLGIACGTFSTNPTPTSSPVPSTATVAATKTKTPAPTNTPDRAATVAAKATQSARDILAEIEDELRDEDIDYRNGELLWKQTGPISVELNGPASQILPFAEDQEVGNFILTSEVTWKASGIIFCGVIFHSEPDFVQGKQYQFVYLRLSGVPAWAIEFHEFGYAKNSPTKVQYSNAIDLANEATNRLTIVVRDEEFIVYINGARQGRFFDYSKQNPSGLFAAMAFQDSGKGSCEYENTYVWALK